MKYIILGILFFTFESSAQEKNCDDFANKYIRSLNPTTPGSVQRSAASYNGNPLSKFNDLDHPGPFVIKSTKEGNSVISFKVAEKEGFKNDGEHMITIGKRDKSDASTIIHRRSLDDAADTVITTIITLDKDCNIFSASKRKNWLHGTKVERTTTINLAGCLEVRSLAERLKKNPPLSVEGITKKLKKIEKDTRSSVVSTKTEVPTDNVEKLSKLCDLAETSWGMKIEAKKKSEGLSEPQSTEADSTLKGR